MDSNLITAVGIDVSKGKSTVAIRRPGGEIVRKPFRIMNRRNIFVVHEAVVLHIKVYSFRFALAGNHPVTDVLRQLIQCQPDRIVVFQIPGACRRAQHCRCSAYRCAEAVSSISGTGHSGA